METTEGSNDAILEVLIVTIFMISTFSLSKSSLRWILFAITVVSTWFVATTAQAAGWITEPVSGTLANYYAIDVSGSFGVAGADSSTVAVTTDGGKNWTAQTVGFGSYFGVEVFASTYALVVGTSGNIYRSTNSGSTWTQMTSGTTVTLRSIDMITSTTGWAVGDSGKILKTTDSGATWTIQTSGTSSSLYRVAAVSDTIAWAAGGSGTILKTTNGGTTWTAQTSGTTTFIRALDAISSTEAWVGTTAGVILHTTNSGTTWSTISTLTGSNYIFSMDFYSSSLGLLTTGDAIRETSNGGVTWTTVSLIDALPSSAYLEDVWDYAGTNERRAVGTLGFIYRYDAVAPSALSGLTVSTGTTDNTPTLSWTASTDGESAVNYELSVDGGTYSDIGTSTSYTLTSALLDGSHTFSVYASDEAQNAGTATSTTKTIEATGPTVGYVTPSAATINVPVALQVIPIDASGVASCTLTVNGVSQGAMSVSGGIYSRSYTFTASGSATAFATCADTLGNSAVGSSTTITVASTADTTAPTVGAITPTSATATQAVTLSVGASDSVGVSSCTLYVSGISQGGMTLSGSTASVNYTFSAAGTYIAYASCSDAAGNSGVGTSTTVTVAAATSSNTGTGSDTVTNTNGEANSGSLIKLVCKDDAEVNDPCKAVYFYSSDNKRHAFPNEKVYFTWYINFDDVQIVNSTFMASITLGKNVTYHPGTRMVKFITVNTVYAVSQDGVLRAIASEDVAKSLYGSTWNKEIDDISDAFYGNYTFGDDVETSSDYDTDEEENSVQNLDDNF